MVFLPAFLDGLARSVSMKKGKYLSEDEDGGKEIANSMMKDSKKNSTLLGSSGFVSSETSKRVTSICTNRGEKGINQDRAIVWEGFGCQEDITFCGMFDGHGPWGHVITKRVKKLFPASLLCQWQQTLASLSSSPECFSPFDLWKQDFLKTFTIMDLDLKIHPSVDSYCSGCTALAAVLQGDHLVVANAGDSRAVIATTSNDGVGLVPVQLSVDFKPNIPEEAERIKQSDGRLFCLDDEPGVYRVGMPNGRSLGLAVSRAFGDYCLKDFGIVSEPEVRYRKITSKDQFLILATDGMWDVMTNDEAVEIVRGVKDRRKSAERLVKKATMLWRKKRRSIAMDDISALCLFFNL
ncbi:protein phosphatase 2C 41 [Hirschfeldia incana]|nr:protein phosphatase 2C 41 [Hirschfeldia incana]